MLFNEAVRSSGELAVSAGVFIGLKAGRTYLLTADIQHSDASVHRIPWCWYDRTNTQLIGHPGVSVSSSIASTAGYARIAQAVIRPLIDIEVEVRNTATPSGGGDLTVEADNGWGEFTSGASIIEIGAVQADVVGGLEFMDIIEVTADATDVTFGASGDGAFQRALDGDVDHEYVVSYYFPDPGALATFSLRPNAVAATYDGIRVFNGSSGVIADMRLWLGTSGDIGGGEGTLLAETGNNRIWNAQAYRSGASDFALQYSGAWQDAGTNITSLVVHSDVASAIKIGARFVLYRKTRTNLRADSAAVYERNAIEVVDPGAIATTERTTGHSTYGGSVVGISARVEDAVTAGTITCNVKVDGVTALTAVLDTTNSTSRVVRAAVGLHKFAADKNISVEFVPSAYDNAGSVPSSVTVQVHLTNDALITQNDRVVAKTVLSANATTLSLTGLDGDLDEEYEIVGKLIVAGGVTWDMTIGPNGDTGNMKTMRVLNGGAGIVSAGGLYSEGAASAGNHLLKFRMRFWAARTQNGVTAHRGFEASQVFQFDVGNLLTNHLISGSYRSSAANLTSLDFVIDIADAILAGSEVVVRRIKA